VALAVAFELFTATMILDNTASGGERFWRRSF
jgi:hypothetical protein